VVAALLVGPVFTQTPEIQKKIEDDLKAARQRQQAEDVEVMRRLLHGAIQSGYGLTGVADVHGWVGRRGGPPMGGAPSGLGPMGGGFPHWKFEQDAHTMPAPEGIYLKGAGIVYTVTLPAPVTDPAAKGGGGDARPLTPWEKARAEVRGEKAERPKAAPPPPPPLADAILRVLAENGKHLTGLAADERVTVVVTFRGPVAGCAACHSDPFGGGDQPEGPARFEPTTDFRWLDERQAPVTEFRLLGGPGDPKVRYGAPSQEGGRPPGGGLDAGPGGGPPDGQHDVASAQALGDLHFRQGKYSDAVVAYNKALDLQRAVLKEVFEKAQGASPVKVQALLTAAELGNKLAQAHLALKDAEAARKHADMAAGWTREAERVSAALAKPPEARPAARLPAKLIVAVSKRDLDQVGAGKMSFDDFRKAATIEIVSFEKK
jgi:hypothetical protein